MNATLSTVFLFFILMGCNENKNNLTIDQKGKWAIYAYNFLDCTQNGQKVSDCNKFLSKNVKRLYKDTVESNNTIIGFVLVDESGVLLPVDCLKYHTVQFDSFNMIKFIYFDDLGRIDIRSSHHIIDSIFCKKINEQNGDVTLSKSLDSLYQVYKALND